MGLGQEDPPLDTAGARDLRPPSGQGQETWEGPPPRAGARHLLTGPRAGCPGSPPSSSPALSGRPLTASEGAEVEAAVRTSL